MPKEVSLIDYLQEVDIPDALRRLIEVISGAVRKISVHIQVAGTGAAGSKNVFGEEQLALDVYANDLILTVLKDSGLVSVLASEEMENQVEGSPQGKYAVCYDPLDGSSLVDVNFAVGSIFGIYEGSCFLGRKGDEMSASLIAVYGPRTTLVLTVRKGVQEFTLCENEFLLTKRDLIIAPSGKNFAPGNLRACKTEEKYKKLMDFWLVNEYTLRYSGGMVPDINHILLKGKGIFTYPGYADAPHGKLRLLYECAPMALLAEQAGGRAIDGYIRILDKTIDSLTQRTPIFIGSSKEVELAEAMMR